MLVMQSGGCTPVLNRSLLGIAKEASAHSVFEKIYGARYGLDGLLEAATDDRGQGPALIDLLAPSHEEWERVGNSPGAALGSTRRAFQPDDGPAVFELLARNDIRYWFIIGGNDSAETGHRITVAARKIGYDLAVINVPKTIDNDLVLTDHSPGYGSAARFVALATMGAGRDAESMGQAAPITVIEVMGRDSGWLAASAALASQDERDAPHAICVPEVPVKEDRFLEVMEDAYARLGFAVAVVAENARGPDGVLGDQEDPWLVDDFGHPYYDGPGRYLAGQLGRHLKVRTRYEKPGTIQRSMIPCVSQTDADEAEMAGRAAVRYALDGHADEIVTLVRQPGEEYACTTGLAPLEQVAGKVKAMPDEFLDPINYTVTSGLIDYARPLVGDPLPLMGRLQ